MVHRHLRNLALTLHAGRVAPFPRIMRHFVCSSLSQLLRAAGGGSRQGPSDQAAGKLGEAAQIPDDEGNGAAMISAEGVEWPPSWIGTDFPTRDRGHVFGGTR